MNKNKPPVTGALIKGPFATFRAALAHCQK